MQSELEEARAQLQAAPGDAEREAELERLRVELVSGGGGYMLRRRRQRRLQVAATQLAQRLFGGALSPRETMAAAADGDGAIGELRVRLVQLSRALDASRAATVNVDAERARLERLNETKDAAAARLHAENERLRKVKRFGAPNTNQTPRFQLAFGDAADHVRTLERQIEFRERQIGRLTLRCSILQLELEGNTAPTSQGSAPANEAHEDTQADRTPKKRRRSQLRRARSLAPPAAADTETPPPAADATASSSEAIESPRQRQRPIASSRAVERATGSVQPTLTALQLLRLLDEGEAADEWADRDRLLRSLLVEFRRLSDVGHFSTRLFAS